LPSKPLLKKTIETITEFLMVLMVIKGNVLVLMETVMVLLLLVACFVFFFVLVLIETVMVLVSNLLSSIGGLLFFYTIKDQ